MKVGFTFSPGRDCVLNFLICIPYPITPFADSTNLVNTYPYILGTGRSSAGGKGKPTLEVKEGLLEGVMFRLKSEGDRELPGLRVKGTVVQAVGTAFYHNLIS